MYGSITDPGMQGAALQPIAGKRGSHRYCITRRVVRSVWELACRRWAARRPQVFQVRNRATSPFRSTANRDNSALAALV
ncbi:hypothetical protein PPUN15366_37400 [Pseudomonas putida]|nr:hypothetical protein PPUN15366_37400 [Pseudomonas putida]